MSVVIVGGNECMVCKYKETCKKHGCSAKIYVKEKGSFSKRMGVPDLMILFTNTVSHKMVKTAVDEAKRKNVEVVRCHTSSGSALENILKEYVA